MNLAGMDSTIGYRPTWAEVSLDNLQHNLRQVRQRIGAGTGVMACVKADAYGHGLIPVARALVEQGVEYLAVASIDEAIRLRRAGIAAPVLVLGLILRQDIGPLFEYGITPTLCTMDLADALEQEACRRRTPVRVHVKIDTGMGRIGVLYPDAFAFVRSLFCLRHVRVEGIFTHLACADVDRVFTGRQIRMFHALVRRLDLEGMHIPLVHAANSMGVVSYRNSHFSMVRPGLILYGLYPDQGLSISLKPVLSLKSRVVHSKRLKAGSGISYGHTYVTARDSTVVTLPIGYGDGYPRNLSNIGPVLINGRQFIVSGRVCMDQIMVDVGDSRVQVGDEAVLIGSQQAMSVGAEFLAELAGTIPYEIVCGLGSRVPRVYTGRTGRPAGSGKGGDQKEAGPQHADVHQRGGRERRQVSRIPQGDAHRIEDVIEESQRQGQAQRR